MEGKPRKEHRATAIEKERSSPEKEGMYSVRRGGQALQRRFDSFHEAYMYGLNTFCSEDFLVWREGWQ